jgi:tRNA-specific 2-thiouridylase
LARELGSGYVATGHYARISYHDESSRYILRKGADIQKDQSYALFSLTQDQLKHILTPLGEYTKSEVREIAEKLSLKVAQRPESQELCFISDNNYNRFIQERMSQRFKPGPIMDMEGNTVGQHRGIQFYTIGQRKGLGSFGKPVYVIRINPAKNIIIIGTKDDLKKYKLTASGGNFISIPKLDEPMKVDVKIRYTDPGAPATVSPLSRDRFEIIFHKPREAITPGQAAVLYDGDIVVGGGWIDGP